MVRVACRAMATRFEIALWGGSEPHLRAAGEEALEEIERLEAQLSLYRSDSDISDMNSRAARDPVIVEPRLFQLLERAAQLHSWTHGAFDITVAPLMRVWGFHEGMGQIPNQTDLAAARAIAGMNLVVLDPTRNTVRFLREGVRLDMGAIGKGYALDRAADTLRSCGVGGALLHGGTSSIVAIGSQPDGSPWPIAVRHPKDPEQSLAVIPLQDRTLSVSGVHGKAFAQEGVRYGHVLDPRTGQPVRNALLSVVVCLSATDGDALSTALLVEGLSFLNELEEIPDLQAALAIEEEGTVQFISHIETIKGMAE